MCRRLLLGIFKLGKAESRIRLVLAWYKTADVVSNACSIETNQPETSRIK